MSFLENWSELISSSWDKLGLFVELGRWNSILNQNRVGAHIIHRSRFSLSFFLSSVFISLSPATYVFHPSSSQTRLILSSNLCFNSIYASYSGNFLLQESRTPEAKLTLFLATEGYTGVSNHLLYLNRTSARVKWRAPTLHTTFKHEQADAESVAWSSARAAAPDFRKCIFSRYHVPLFV